MGQVLLRVLHDVFDDGVNAADEIFGDIFAMSCWIQQRGMTDECGMLTWVEQSQVDLGLVWRQV